MKISIIIPVYFAEKFLEQTIQSIEYQTLAADEIIMINDGSKDGSWEIMQNLAAKNPNIKIYSQDNAGPSVTRNRGVAYAKNEWICFVDADDILHPQRLEMASSFTEDVDAVICDFKRFSENEMPVFTSYEKEKIAKDFTHTLSIHNSNTSVLKYGYGLPRMLMKKFAFIDAGGLDESLVNNEDHELHFRMLTKGVQFRKINVPLYYYRQHQSQTRLTNQKNSIDFIYKALYKIIDQIPALAPELQPMAKYEIGNRLASNALKQARMGDKAYKSHLAKAKALNPNLKPYHKNFHNQLSRIFGYGNIENIISKLK